MPEIKEDNKYKRGKIKQTPIFEIIKKYNQKYGENRFYVYNINICQKQIFDNEWWELDMIDIAIFTAIKEIISSGFCSRKEDTKGIWYNLTENLIISYIPIIGISNVSSISKRVRKLEKYKLIEKNPTNINGGKKWIRLGEDAHKMNIFKKEIKPEVL